MNDVIKKPYMKSSYDMEQLEQLARCMDDPIYFMETFVKIQHSTMGLVPLKLYPFQKELVLAFANNRFCIGTLARQMGKTTCAAAYILWKTTFTPDFIVLITGNIFSASVEVSNRIHGMWETLPDFLRAGAVEYNKSNIVFDNGSRIISRATTPHAGRGLSISLLYCLGGAEEVTVRDKITGEISNIPLATLKTMLSN